MKAAPSPYDAGSVLNVYKPEGCTSHTAVQQVRRILGYRKVGHTGTLDPFATGVLLCCIGRATKLSGILMELTKEYQGAMLFGVRTDTGDIAGTVLEDRSLPLPDRAALDAAAKEFEGEILQVPPMVSALKYHGRRLYELAREGVEVERPPRRVYVESFQILGAEDRHIGFRVRCTRGTYVRALIEDFGARLAGVACVEQLCRTRIGSFRVEDATRLAPPPTVEELVAHATSMSAALAHLPGWTVPPFWARKVRDGHAPPWVVLDLQDPPEPGQTGRLISANGDLIALGRAVPVSGRADRPWHDTLNLELLRVL